MTMKQVDELKKSREGKNLGDLVAGDQLIDPVCDMTVSSDSEYHFKVAEKQYYFCSEHCLHKFKENPEHYQDKKPSQPLATDNESQTYTCAFVPVTKYRWMVQLSAARAI